MFWIVSLFVLGFLLSGFRKISQEERAAVIGPWRRLNRVAGPGIVYVIPLIQKLHRVTVEPFSVSLPPQSAITKDEIPIQLQASLDARVLDPERAVGSVRDWRVHLTSHLQNLMKDQLENLDFDHLDETFPKWVASIRSQMEASGKEIGVEITGLQISNLSPRERPKL